jgi:hypothetical protein
MKPATGWLTFLSTSHPTDPSTRMGFLANGSILDPTLYTLSKQTMLLAKTQLFHKGIITRANPLPAPVPAIQSRLLTPQDYITDDGISDEWHSSLDGYLRAFSKDLDLSNLDAAGGLLYFILLDAFATCPEQYLSPSRSELRNILRDEEPVLELLKQCYRDRAYTRIRKLSEWFFVHQRVILT